MIQPLPRERPLLGVLGDVLTDVGYGLGEGGFDRGLGIAARRGAEMAPNRAAGRLARKREAERLALAKANATYIKDPALAQAVASGQMEFGDAYRMWQDQQAAARGPEPTANMRDYEYAQQNPGYAEFLNPTKSADQPALVQEFEYAKANGYQGSFTDYQRDTSARSLNGMDATTRKELFDAEDAVTAGDYVLSALDRALELNQSAVDGPFAGERAYAGAMIPDIGVGDGNTQDHATLEFKNITTELALNQLKTIFGAMPTEGERKILLELQGSVDQPKAVRESILQRARVMAERRIADNRQKADALRSGGYFQPGYGQQPTTPGGTTSTGVPWSIEP